MRYILPITYALPIVFVSLLDGREFKMPHPQETLEQAKHFESLKILQEAGYKTSDIEIRKHIQNIHKKSSNVYEYFCNQSQKNKEKLAQKLNLKIEEIKQNIEERDAIVNDIAQAGIVELYSINELPKPLQTSALNFIRINKDKLPQNIYFCNGEQYSSTLLDWQNKEGIIEVPPVIQNVLQAQFIVNHELGHLCDKNPALATFKNILKQHVHEIYNKQKWWKSKSKEKILAEIQQRYNYINDLQQACNTQELIADAFATVSDKKMCKTGYDNFTNTNEAFYPWNQQDNYTHPSYKVRAHQMASLYKYYKTEQKMCKEYALMGYQHGNLFN